MRMAVRYLIMSCFTLALLLPAMYRRYRGRSGSTAAIHSTRRGRVLIAAMVSLVVIGIVAGAAFATDGDKDGSKTGVPVVSASESAKPVDQQIGDVVAQSEKNRVS